MWKAESVHVSLPLPSPYEESHYGSVPQLSNSLAAKRRKERERAHWKKCRYFIHCLGCHASINLPEASHYSYLNPFCSHINAEGKFHEPHKYRLQNRRCLRGRLYVSTWLQDTCKWKDYMIYETIVIIILVRVFRKVNLNNTLLLHCLYIIYEIYV